jgi:hypothetical protein
MKTQLYWLSDAEWKRIEPLMPRGRRGAHRVDDRRVISGIEQFWKLCAPIARQQNHEKWCRARGLNPRPSVYKTAALPLS